MTRPGYFGRDVAAAQGAAGFGQRADQGVEQHADQAMGRGAVHARRGIHLFVGAGLALRHVGSGGGSEHGVLAFCKGLDCLVIGAPSRVLEPCVMHETPGSARPRADQELLVLLFQFAICCVM